MAEIQEDDAELARLKEVMAREEGLADVDQGLIKAQIFRRYGERQSLLTRMN